MKDHDKSCMYLYSERGQCPHPCTCGYHDEIPENNVMSKEEIIGRFVMAKWPPAHIDELLRQLAEAEEKGYY